MTSAGSSEEWPMLKKKAAKANGEKISKQIKNYIQ